MPPQQPYGYMPQQPYTPPYAPGYQSYQQPEMPQGYDAPMQHAAYAPQQPAPDMRMYGQAPGYDPYGQQGRASYYNTPDDGYRPQHMREPEEPARAPYFDDPFYNEGADQYAQAEDDEFENLPSLAQLQQALEEERQAEARQRAMEAQQRAREAQQRAMEAQQKERGRRRMPQQPPVQPQKPAPQQTRPAPAPEYPSEQAPQRFVIEDLSLDDEESHTARRNNPDSKTQFSSLLKRFRPKNS